MLLNITISAAYIAIIVFAVLILLILVFILGERTGREYEKARCVYKACIDEKPLHPEDVVIHKTQQIASDLAKSKNKMNQLEERINTEEQKFIDDYYKSTGFEKP